MKAVLFACDERSALELASAAKAMGACDVVEIRVGAWEGKTAASTVAKLPLGEGVAHESSYRSVAAWLAGRDYDLVLASPTRRLKVLVGLLAADAKASVIANVSSFEGDVAVTRYFGGLADRRLKPSSDVAFYYLGSGLFEPSVAVEEAVEVEIPWVNPGVCCKVINRQELAKGQADLAKVDVVVSCGRGFAEKEDLELAGDLATKLGAAVGCTRPLTEAVNWFSRDAYIGVSGQIIKPKVFIAVGVSGQMQHMVGANGAEFIIAINKDGDAPVFRQCDLGIVGDLKQVLPALTAAL